MAQSREFLVRRSASASIYSAAAAALPAIVRQEKARPLGSPVKAPDSLVQASNSAGTPKNSHIPAARPLLVECLLPPPEELHAARAPARPTKSSSWIEKQRLNSQELQRQPEILNQERLRVPGGCFVYSIWTPEQRSSGAKQSAGSESAQNRAANSLDHRLKQQEQQLRLRFVPRCQNLTVGTT